MICEYCKLIHSIDARYPLREANRDLESDFPRCDWHWRYICDVCGKPRHFNGITWCEKSGKFICLRCGEDHRLVTGEFWKWSSYYAIKCPLCHGRHPALDRLEFEGEHPWQLHPEMHLQKRNLSSEEYLGFVSQYISGDHVISDKMVGEAWDRAANRWWGGYDEFGDKNRRYIIDPAILAILGQVEGKRILDAGCGNGYLCRLLSKKGARMVGVDVSEEAIEMAKVAERRDPLGIRYHVGSLCNMSMFRNSMFDAVVSNIVLSDLQDMNSAFAEIRRVLKSRGKLVFSIMHPCFSSAPVHGWVKRPLDSDRAEDWLYWKVDRYFERGIEEWRYGDLPPLYSFHRPLSDYVKALINNGFVLTDFEEPVPAKKDIEEHYRELNDGERIAWFLVVGTVKTRRASLH